MALNKIKVVLGIILVSLGIWDIIRGEFLLAMAGIVGILFLISAFLKEAETQNKN